MKKSNEESTEINNLETTQKENKYLEKERDDKTKKNGIDEMNLAELPISVAGRGVKENTREFKIGNKKIIIMTPEQIGLPTYEEENFLLGLLGLAKLKNQLNDRKFYFTPYELFKLMGKRTCGGRDYVQLNDALQKLNSESCYFYETWYDVKEKKYIDTVRGCHFIDEYFLWYEHKEDDIANVRNKVCYIIWGNFLWESIQNGFIKNLDIDFYFSLNLPLTQKLFRLLDKWFYKREEIRINIFELSARLGMSEYKHFSKVFEKIKPACEELKANGFIEFYKPENKLVLYFKRGKNFVPKEKRLPAPKKKIVLDGHGEYVLERACQECNRDDVYFKNTITKYINLLNSHIVDGLIGETKMRQDVKSRSRYLITLLKKETKKLQPKLL